MSAFIARSVFGLSIRTTSSTQVQVLSGPVKHSKGTGFKILGVAPARQLSAAQKASYRTCRTATPLCVLQLVPSVYAAVKVFYMDIHKSSFFIGCDHKR